MTGAETRWRPLVVTQQNKVFICVSVTRRRRRVALSWSPPSNCVTAACWGTSAASSPTCKQPLTCASCDPFGLCVNSELLLLAGTTACWGSELFAGSTAACCLPTSASTCVQRRWVWHHFLLSCRNRMLTCVCCSCSGSVSIRSLWPPSCALWAETKVWTSLRTWNLQRVSTSRWDGTPTFDCPFVAKASRRVRAFYFRCETDRMTSSCRPGEMFKRSRRVWDRRRDCDPAEEEQSGQSRKLLLLLL